ncbi:hypothetical protein ACOMHN_056954 [Nucella lapillus]
MKDRRGTLTQEMNEIDHIVTAVQVQCSKLQEQKRTTEAAFRARTDTLHQWVKQSLEEAMSSLQSSSEQRAKPWQEGAEQLGGMKQALQAQQDHILRVMKDGQEADLVSLEAQLSSGPEEDDMTLTQMKAELTRDMPAFAVEYSTTAVNPVQLQTFIGMLVPPQQTSRPEGADTPSQPTFVMGKPSPAVSAKGSDVTHRGDCPPPARGLVKVGMKKPPREFQYSADKGSSVRAMCPISQSRLWVMHHPPPTHSVCLTLFDAEGRVLTTVENLKYCTGLVTMTDDVILSWTCGDSSVQLVTPDGSVRTCHLGSEVEGIFSSATNDIHYLRKRGDDRLYWVELVNQNQSGHAAPRSAAAHPKMRVTPAVKDQSTLSVTEVVLEDMSLYEWLPRQASAVGRYFVFILNDDTVNVYGRAWSAVISSYRSETGGRPADAGFCQIDGQEMLLVTVFDDNKVHVIDYADGGRLVRYLDTGPLNLDEPCCLATDYDRQVWIGCKGGKVTVVVL